MCKDAQEEVDALKLQVRDDKKFKAKWPNCWGKGDKPPAFKLSLRNPSSTPPRVRCSLGVRWGWRLPSST